MLKRKGAHDFTHMISHIVGPNRDPLYTGFSIRNTLRYNLKKMEGKKGKGSKVFTEP
jgi:hypothetical protein